MINGLICWWIDNMAVLGCEPLWDNRSLGLWKIYLNFGPFWPSGSWMPSSEQLLPHPSSVVLLPWQCQWWSQPVNGRNFWNPEPKQRSSILTRRSLQSCNGKLTSNDGNRLGKCESSPLGLFLDERRVHYGLVRRGVSSSEAQHTCCAFKAFRPPEFEPRSP